jgi:hypothetical protein
MCIQRSGGETEGMRVFGRTGYRWDGSVRIDLQEMGWSRYIEWIDLTGDRDKWWDVV